MMRSELIPQTKADLGSGTLYYHFSLQTREENAPDASLEHQIAFFEVRPHLSTYSPVPFISTSNLWIEPFHRAQIRRQPVHPELDGE